MSDPQPIPGPPYAVHAEQRHDYLRVVISGVRSTLEVSIAGWREVGRLVRQHHARRVLVISKLNGPMPTPEQQRQTVQALVGHGFEGVRTAFVLEDSLHVAELEHGEIQSREMGQESRVFGSEALAALWLRHGDSTPPQHRRR